MKRKLLIMLILVGILSMLNSCSKARASNFFGPSAAEQDTKQRLSAVEALLTTQRQHTEAWQIISGALGVGCVLVLVIGTALGANTRRQHASV